ncbi:MAG TPA: hypothetical protein VLT33_03030 [Labilithrix sp.]|nr:hypothetical protein [Labilithrix sp.]
MRLRILLPLVALMTAALLQASAGCSSLKEADAADPGGEAGADGTTDPQGEAGGDGAAADGAVDPDGGPAAETCTQATCTVETLYKNLYGPVSLAVNSTHLYWLEVGPTTSHPGGYGELVRVAKTFTCKTASCFDILDDTLFSGQLQGQNIYEAHVALGLNDVCYTQSFNTNAEHTVRCFALSTLARRPFDDGPGALIDLWVGTTEARWVLASTTGSSADGLVRGRALGGDAGARTIAGGLRNPIGVSSDGTKTYWTELGPASPQGLVSTVGADGGVVNLATGRANPTAIRLYGQYLYWIEASKKVIMRGRADGTGAPEQIATTDDNPVDLVVDASGVYWIASGVGSSGVAGSLSHAPLEPNGVITIMIKDINLVYALAADTTHVYVASVGQMIADGQIVRIKKTR